MAWHQQQGPGIPDTPGIPPQTLHVTKGLTACLRTIVPEASALPAPAVEPGGTPMKNLELALPV